MIIERSYEYKGVRCINGIDPLEFCRLVQFDVEPGHKMYGLKQEDIIFDKEFKFLHDVCVTSFEYENVWYIIFKFDRATDVKFYSEVEELIEKNKINFNQKSIETICQQLEIKKKPYLLKTTAEMIDDYMLKVLEKYT